MTFYSYVLGNFPVSGSFEVTRWSWIKIILAEVEIQGVNSYNSLITYIRSNWNSRSRGIQGINVSLWINGPVNSLKIAESPILDHHWWVPQQSFIRWWVPHQIHKGQHMSDLIVFLKIMDGSGRAIVIPWNYSQGND